MKNKGMMQQLLNFSVRQTVKGELPNLREKIVVASRQAELLVQVFKQNNVNDAESQRIIQALKTQAAVLANVAETIKNL